MGALSSRSTEGKLAQRAARKLFTMEVVLEYNITVFTVQRSYEILMYFAAQGIVMSIICRSG